MHFGNKKYLELELKIDSIIGLLEAEQEILKNLSERVNDIEKRQDEICKKTELAVENNEQGFQLIKWKLEEAFQKAREYHDNKSSEAMDTINENIVLLSDKMAGMRNDDRKIIENIGEDTKAARVALDRIEKSNGELEKGIELICNEIQMLLLNSVMEQI